MGKNKSIHTQSLATRHRAIVSLNQIAPIWGARAAGASRAPRWHLMFGTQHPSRKLKEGREEGSGTRTQMDRVRDTANYTLRRY